MLKSLAVALLSLAIAPVVPTALAEVTFKVTRDAGPEAAIDGRLIVYVLGEDDPDWQRDPGGAPFYRGAAPVFGTDAADFETGQTLSLTDGGELPTASEGALSPGKYKAQAVLDRQHGDSVWRREDGNLFSETVEFTVEESGDVTVELSLSEEVEPREVSERDEVKVVEVQSKLMPEVTLRAMVVLPIDYDESKQYAAVYVTPGFGGNHTGAAGYLRNTELRKHAFVIGIDPESGNGHTLFVDSEVNGPRGKMLTEELVPYLESQYPLVAEAPARIITGHSSGGWSSLWAATEYPEVFGACWSSGPDPVDFRRFQMINLYEDDNFYVDADGEPFPLARFGDPAGEQTVALNVRDHSFVEEVIGPGNSSGLQMDAFQACWGTDSDGDGFADPLHDVETGEINKQQAEAFKDHDIRLRLANDPEHFVPIFANNVRLVCGAQDNFYLNEAVALLQEELAKHDLPDGPGYVKLVDAADHGMSLYRSEEMQGFTGEMIEHLKASGYAQED